MSKAEITLRVPCEKAYALVLRLALGGVAILKDLDAGTLDDLRVACDEAVDCLLHQGREVSQLEMTAADDGDRLTVSVAAEFASRTGENAEDCQDETEISRAVLETLVPFVALHAADCGCISRIDLTLPKAVRMGA